jgi:protein Mpv17
VVVAAWAVAAGNCSSKSSSLSTLKLTASRPAMQTSGGRGRTAVTVGDVVNAGSFAVLRALPRGGGGGEEDVQVEGSSFDGSSSNRDDYEEKGLVRRTNDDELATPPGGRSDGGATSSIQATKTAMLLPSSISSLLVNFGRMYVNQLSLHPILTKSVTAGIIFGLSDLCAQSIENNNGNVDSSSSSSSNSTTTLSYSRIFTSILVGLLFFGPAAHYWYSFVFHILPSTTLLSTIQKAILGQLIFGPIFTSIFFGAGLLQSSSFTFNSWYRKVKIDLPVVWVKGLSYWPIVDIISFMLVPVRWIPLFVNVASFIWTIYLSSVTNTV